MTDFDAHSVNSLAQKLDALGLTTSERAALDCILDRAGDEGDDEVVGFAMFDKPGADSYVVQEERAKVKQPDLSVPGVKIANALGWRF